MNCQGSEGLEKDDTIMEIESRIIIQAIAKCCSECNSVLYTQHPLT